MGPLNRTEEGRSPRPGEREIRAALAVSEVDGLGPRRLHELYRRFGSFAAILHAARAGDPELRAALGGKRAARLAGAVPAPARRLRILREDGIQVVVRGSGDYPERLLHLHDPPPLLYLMGRRRALDPPAVAVVGTRRATEYGRRVARDLAGALAGAGVCVISGMARGIDARAHEGALDAGGRTLGVLGSGLEHRYPAANRRLYDRMERSGLLASEFPPSQAPQRGFFPRRNRIIAALARAVVVVQAGRPSGALNTVTHALDLGREVLAVPGPVGLPASEGVHALLREGAGLAAEPADVLEVLGWPSDAAPAGTDVAGGASAGRSGASAPGGEGEAWDAARAALDEGPRSVEELSAATSLPVPALLARLTCWELDGRVEAAEGGRYAARRRPVGEMGPGTADR